MNKFSRMLNEVLKEYDGTEIFSEENALRLKKAFEKKNDCEVLSLACIMGLPQKLYAAKECKPDSQAI